jgi:hypothetical protein
VKRSTAITLAALAMATSAFAQSQRPMAQPSDHSDSVVGFDYSAPYIPYMPSGKYLEEKLASIDRMHMSCAADQQRLCAGKGPAAMRCVNHHKLEISRSCRVDMEKAQQGRL